MQQPDAVLTSDPFRHLTSRLVYVEGSFDACVHALRTAKPAYLPARAYHLFSARAAEPDPDAPVNRFMYWVGEGVVFWPKSDRFPESFITLLRPDVNPIAKYPHYAAAAVRAQASQPTDVQRLHEGLEFFLDDALQEEIFAAIQADAEKPLLERHACAFRFAESHSAKTNRLADDPLFLYLLGNEEVAQRYGLHLQEHHVNETGVSFQRLAYVERQSRPFIRQLWADGLASPIMASTTPSLPYPKGRLCGVAPTLF